MAAIIGSARSWLAVALASVVPLPGQQNPCAVSQLTKSVVQGLKVFAPDGRRYLVNMPDSAGTPQIYVSQDGSSNLVCITCVQTLNGPKPIRFKMQPHWHPSGNWIFLAVERDNYNPPPFATKDYIDGQLQSGIWTDMWTVTPDGAAWHRLTDFSGAPGVAGGFTGPAFTPDGKKAVWSQIMDGNIFAYYPFGRWELTQADFDTPSGIPTLTNLRNITPPGMNWNEPGNFHPDNESLLFTGSDQADAEGMDQYILNIRTGTLVNLTNSPTVWDEHGVFSPDGEKIIFMSAYPYQSDPSSSKILTIKTEFMLMNRDGSNVMQLTHFRQPGYPEYSSAGGIAANAEWNPDGKTANLARLFFPAYEYWDVSFQGDCGNNTVINFVANPFGDNPVIAANTWMEIKGWNLAPAGDSRVWQGPDFVNRQLPTKLDGVSVTVNGKSAYLYFISPTRVILLTPPDALSGSIQVQLTNNGATSNVVSVQAQALSPSFFEAVSSSGVHYVYGTHARDGSFVGPNSLFPNSSRPVTPGESVYLIANGFGPTDTPVVSGSLTQTGKLSLLPVVKIGGIPATVNSASLIGIGTYAIQLTIPSGVPDGDLPVSATYNGSSTQPNVLITVRH